MVNTKIIGILNITPDSFSGDGYANQSMKAFFYLEKLIKSGVSIIDIGAESTRPRAAEVTTDEEWKRLSEILPLAIDCVQKYNRKNSSEIKISLDSRNHRTISKALILGINIINDVGGFEKKENIALAAASGKKIIVMHNLGVPADKNKIIPEELNVVDEIIKWMEKKLSELEKLGIKKEQIIFDPGIGFGKNAQQSIQILKNIDSFRSLDLPILIGHSKKSFLDEVKWDKKFGEENRENKTLAISNFLAKKNVEYLRVHDVVENKLAIDENKFEDFEL